MPRKDPLPRMNLRFRAGELAAIEDAARAYGLPRASYCAAVVRAGVGLPFDPGASSKPQIVALTDELRRVGVNLNQIARSLNEARAVRDEEVLEAVVALIEVVDTIRGEYRGLLASGRENLRLRLSAVASPAEGT
jgi:hypothetical protein